MGNESYGSSVYTLQVLSPNDAPQQSALFQQLNLSGFFVRMKLLSGLFFFSLCIFKVLFQNTHGQVVFKQNSPFCVLRIQSSLGGSKYLDIRNSSFSQRRMPQFCLNAGVPFLYHREYFHFICLTRWQLSWLRAVSQHRLKCVVRHTKHITMISSHTNIVIRYLDAFLIDFISIQYITKLLI